MRQANITPEDSIQDNLDTFCFEVGSVYEQYSTESARRFIKHIKKQPVIDLGSGDGAATNVFIENGNKTTAVDINKEKLDKVKGGVKIQKDFVSFLSKPVDNIFMHHSLEHYVDYQTVLDLISKHLKKGKYCYIAVPKNDSPHSVHHVAFDNISEIIPQGLTVVEKNERDDVVWSEYSVIVRKD